MPVYLKPKHRVVYVYHSTSDTLAAATINTTETAFAGSYTIPAGRLFENKVYRVTVGFALTTSGSPATQRMRIRLGGVAGTLTWDSTAFAPSVNQAARPISASFLIQGLAAPGGSVSVNTIGPIGTAGAPTSFLATSTTTAQPVSSIATNTNLAIAFTLQFGANTAGNEVTMLSMMVEEIFP